MLLTFMLYNGRRKLVDLVCCTHGKGLVVAPAAAVQWRATAAASREEKFALLLLLLLGGFQSSALPHGARLATTKVSAIGNDDLEPFVIKSGCLILIVLQTLGHGPQCDSGPRGPQGPRGSQGPRQRVGQ